MKPPPVSTALFQLEPTSVVTGTISTNNKKHGETFSSSSTSLFSFGVTDDRSPPASSLEPPHHVITGTSATTSTTTNNGGNHEAQKFLSSSTLTSFNHPRATSFERPFLNNNKAPSFPQKPSSQAAALLLCGTSTSSTCTIQQPKTNEASSSFSTGVLDASNKSDEIENLLEQENKYHKKELFVQSVPNCTHKT